MSPNPSRSAPCTSSGRRPASLRQRPNPVSRSSRAASAPAARRPGARLLRGGPWLAGSHYWFRLAAVPPLPRSGSAAIRCRSVAARHLAHGGVDPLAAPLHGLNVQPRLRDSSVPHAQDDDAGHLQRATVLVGAMPAPFSPHRARLDCRGDEFSAEVRDAREHGRPVSPDLISAPECPIRMYRLLAVVV